RVGTTGVNYGGRGRLGTTGKRVRLPRGEARTTEGGWANRQGERDEPPRRQERQGEKRGGEGREGKGGERSRETEGLPLVEGARWPSGLRDGESRSAWGGGRRAEIRVQSVGVETCGSRRLGARTALSGGGHDSGRARVEQCRRGELGPGRLVRRGGGSS